MQRSNYPPQNQAYYAQPEQPQQPQPVVYQRPQTYVQAQPKMVPQQPVIYQKPQAYVPMVQAEPEPLYTQQPPAYVEPQPIYESEPVYYQEPQARVVPQLTEQYYQPIPRGSGVAMGNPEQIVIEADDTDFNQEEFDEGTVATNYGQKRIGTRYEQDVLPSVSPRVQVTRAYQPPVVYTDDAVVKVEEAFDAQRQRFAKPHVTRDQWVDIQQKIDREYESKLKQVGDDAMQKLKSFQAEHKDLLEKTQYLIDTAEEPQSASAPVSNVQTIRQFHKEFNDILTFESNVANELYLVDVLKKLHLLPTGEELPSKEFERELYNLLNNSNDNLLIRSELEEVSGDLSRNLFKVCCAILDLQVNQRGHAFLDKTLLQSYLMHINYTSTDGYPSQTIGVANQCSEELCLIPVPLHLKEVGIQAGHFYEESEMVTISGFTLRDQLASIKSLVNRPAYSLNDAQIRHIGEAFQNFADNRRSFVAQQTNNYDSIVEEQVVPQAPVMTPSKQAQTITKQQVNYVDPRYSARGPQRYNPEVQQQKLLDQQVLQRFVPQTEVKEQPQKVYYKASPNTRTLRMSNTVTKPEYQPREQQPQKWQYMPVPTTQVIRPINSEAPREDSTQMSFGASSRNIKPSSPRPVENYRKVSPNNQMKPPTRFAPVVTRNTVNLRKSNMPAQPSPNARPDTGTRLAPQKRFSSPRGAIKPATKQPARNTVAMPASYQPKKDLPIVDYTGEEPLCVLKVELDGGENVQHISVYEGQIAEEIVQDFGMKFNLSENAKLRLLQQIDAQINN